MKPIPQESWPGLVHFSPERFPALLSQLDALEPGSKERQLVVAEVETLVNSFRSWAADFRRQRRDAELLFLARRVQRERKMDKEFWTKNFDALASAELTPTEEERLALLIIKKTNRTTKPIKTALDALEKTKRSR